ncbi:hypothetical protein H5410_022944 [Solanum commersonii]|uniref:Uncharacterized protein n=1 Tax=Solanum commersonii TaxID=4109 RepID=A0A9J5ZI52_SOLCO|nr:hypothetical protein H5410_022944 [Solanum commersonii]
MKEDMDAPRNTDKLVMSEPPMKASEVGRCTMILSILSSPALVSCLMVVRAENLGIKNGREINVANTQTNVTQDIVGNKGYGKKRNVTNKYQEVPEVEPNEGLTSQEPSTTKASEYDVKVLPEEVLLGRE